MKFINLQKSRLVRFLVVTIVCLGMFFSLSMPVFAAGGSKNAMSGTKSNPTEGEMQMHKIYENSEDALRDPPMSLKDIRDRSNEGINEVQGAGDAEKMKRPSNSQGATSFEDTVKKVLGDSDKAQN